VIAACSDSSPPKAKQAPETVKTQPSASPPDQTLVSNGAESADTQQESKTTVLLGSPELTAGIPGKGALTVEDIQKWLDDPRNHEPLDLELPFGLNVYPSRLEKLRSRLTRARIELGRQLFFDTRISGDNSVSCASCHNPDHGYTIPERFAKGIGGQVGTRNPPALYNRVMFGGIGEEEFWDGHAASIEDAVLIAITDSAEMGNTLESLLKSIRTVDGYRMQFEKIYGKVTLAAVGDAVASFVRVLVTGPSAFDYHSAFQPFESEDPQKLADEDPEVFAKYQRIAAGMKAQPMSAGALRGKDLYFGTRTFCNPCHIEPALTDNGYYNLGVGIDAPNPDLGRYLVTGKEEDRGKFKTPPVRNAVLTAPYMHDGSLATLEDVIDWYAKGGHPNPNLSDRMRKITLNEQEKKDLVEFIKACSGELPKVERGRLPQ
jgi:cytochrome c peroxidase